MVLHVINFHHLEEGVISWGSVMQEVVHQIVDLVTDQKSEHEWIREEGW
jgi:hypothetical protein